MTEYKLPEPVAHCQLSIGRKTVAYFDGKPIFMTGPVGNDSHRYPLYTAAQIAAKFAESQEEITNLKLGLANYRELFAERDALQSERDTLASLAKHDRTLISEAIRTQTEYTLIIVQDGYKLMKLGQAVAQKAQLAERRDPLTLERNADKTLEEIVGEIRALKGTK
jgi:hypothetical protein